MFTGTQRWDRFNIGESQVAIAAMADWPLKISILASGDTILSRGARAPLPLHLIYESPDLRLAPNQSLRWRLLIKVAGPQLERRELALP